MRKDREPATSMGQLSVTTVIGTFVFLLLLSFADCASGSCLSYGHSCWGAHGKRSNGGLGIHLHRSIDAHRNAGLVAEVETDENAPATRNNNRWILSRLITGRLTVPAPVSTAGNRRGNRWHETQKILEIPGNWDTDYDSTREQKAEDSENIESRKNIDDNIELARNLRETQKDTADLLFLPARNEFGNQPSRFRKIRPIHLTTSFNNGQSFHNMKILDGTRGQMRNSRQSFRIDMPSRRVLPGASSPRRCTNL